VQTIRTHLGGNVTTEVRVVLLLIAGCFLAASQSQPPAPTPTKPSHDDQRKSSTENSKGRSNQGSTKSVSTTGTKSTSEVTGGNKSNLATESENKTSPEWWLIASTIISALATVAIALLGYFQWQAMHKQRLAMEEQARYMRDTLEENKKSADASVVSADAARSSAETASRQAALLERQAATSEESIQIAKQSADAATKSADAAQASVSMARNALYAQRAFIQPVAMNFFIANNILLEGMPLTSDTNVKIGIKNNGASRALNLTFKGHLSILPGNESTTLVSPLAVDLAPSGDMWIAFDAFKRWLDPRSITLLQERKVSLTFTLAIVYADIFGASHEWEAEGELRDWTHRTWEIGRIRST